MGCGIFTHIAMAVATGLAPWARLNCLLVLALVVVILASLGIILAWGRAFHLAQDIHALFFTLFMCSWRQKADLGFESVLGGWLKGQAGKEKV